MSDHSGTYIPFQGRLTPPSAIIEAWFWKHPGRPLGPANLRSEIHPRCSWHSVIVVMRRLKKLGWTFERVSNGSHDWRYAGAPPDRPDGAGG